MKCGLLAAFTNSLAMPLRAAAADASADGNASKTYLGEIDRKHIEVLLLDAAV